MGRPDFAPLQNDVGRRPEIRAALEAIFVERDQDEWLAILENAGTQFAPVYDIAEALADPHNRARGMVVETAGANGAPVRHVGPPVRFDTRNPVRWLGHPPGADTESVLAELGYGSAERDELRRSGALGAEN